MTRKNEARRIITRGYMLALLLVVATSIAGHYLTNRIVRQQENAAVEINIAGRQRMLSQRIALFSNLLVKETNAGQQFITHAELTRARDLFAASHQTLINGDKETGVGPMTTPSVMEVYTDNPYFLNKQVELFLEKVDLLLALPFDSADADLLALEIFDAANTKLLLDLNRVVTRREAEARAIISRAENFELVALLMTLVTLCLEVLFIFAPMANIIERREEALREARHDHLTGLANRRHLTEELAARARQCAQSGGSLGLLHIDLDRFKHINDTIGHAAGDFVLQQTSKILKTHTPDDCLVARIGGDEFVVVVSFDGNRDQLEVIATKIIESIREPMQFENQVCRISASVGIAVETGGFVDPDRMMIDADLALYLTKRRGKNGVEFFTPELRTEENDTRLLSNEIADGLENSEFEPYFQGQYSADLNELLGVEALARWNHPTRGVLLPEEFLKVAEQMGLIAAIDQQILEKSCLQLEIWNQQQVRIPRLSVNVSGARLSSSDFLKQVTALLSPRSVLAFEVRETIFSGPSNDVIKWNIDQLRELGVELDVDDFGCGRASILGLMELKPDRLKIDRKLVGPVINAPNNRAVIRSIVDIAKVLKADVIAEGIETKEHLDIVKDLDCYGLQGYALGRPVPAAQFYQHYLAASA